MEENSGFYIKKYYIPFYVFVSEMFFRFSD